jgi:hypothetical protein
MWQVAARIDHHGTHRRLAPKQSAILLEGRYRYYDGFDSTHGRPVQDRYEYNWVEVEASKFKVACRIFGPNLFREELSRITNILVVLYSISTTHAA